MLLPSVLVALALLQAPVERAGPHFRIVSHLVLERLADEALAAAEAAWPLAVDELGLKEKKPSEPLTIHLYADAAGFEAAEQELTRGAFKQNRTFSHFATKSAHVTVEPPSSAQTLLELGLPTLTLYHVAHEAAHLTSYAHLPNSLDHLEWFCEGMATEVSLGALVAIGRMRAGLAEPLAARELVLCKTLLGEGKLPEARAVMGAEIGDLEFYARYAVNHRFYALMRGRHGKDFDRMAKAMREQEGGASFRAGVLGEFGKLWKEKELEKLQTEWLADVRGGEPEWDQVFRSLETRGTKGEHYVQRAFPDTNAIAFRSQAMGALPFVATGTVRAVPGDAHQMNFLLGRSDKGFLSVAFSFPSGVTVFRCDYGETATWTVLGQAAVEGLRIGAWTPFRIEATAEELRVSVNGAEALRAKLHGRSPLGQWGLGAQAKAAGEWKDLVVEAP
jgi:hypothetical protein